MDHTVVLEQHSSGVLAPLLTGAFGLLAALAGAGLTHLAATRREERTRRETVAREQRNREADIDRERLRDLREVVDDAAVALHDLWVILSAFGAAVPRGPGESPLPPGVPVGVSVVQARPPDRSAYMAAHVRLSDTHTRLTLRVDRDDALLGPVSSAVGRSQEAWNTIVLQDDPFTPDRASEEKKRINRALHACASAYPDLTKADKMRFASAPLPNTLRQFSLQLETQPAECWHLDAAPAPGRHLGSPQGGTASEPNDRSGGEDRVGQPSVAPTARRLTPRKRRSPRWLPPHDEQRSDRQRRLGQDGSR